MKFAATAMLFVFPATVRSCTVQRTYYKASDCSGSAAFASSDPCGTCDDNQQYTCDGEKGTETTISWKNTGCTGGIDFQKDHPLNTCTPWNDEYNIILHCLENEAVIANVTQESSIPRERKAIANTTQETSIPHERKAKLSVVV